MLAALCQGFRRDPERALAAYRHAISFNPASAAGVQVTWKLADLLAERGVD
jgi:hypothetical protein